MNIINKIFNAIKKRKNIIKFLRNSGVTIGEECEIYYSANFGSEPYLVKIGNHVRINSGVNFITHDGGVWVLRKYSKLDNKENIDLFGKITIGNNVHIGTNAIIMPNVNIGNNCIIGCGAIVTKDIPDNSVAVGIPAHVIESIDEYEKKNLNRFDYTKKMNRKEKNEYLKKKYK